VTNGYDGFGRLVSSGIDMGGMARALRYAWDAAGNRTRITHPDGAHFDSRYDGLNRLIGMKENGDSDIVSQVYHPTGERYLTGRAYATLGWLYDGVGRLSYRINDMPGTAGVNWTFERNPANQIVSAARSNDAYAWTRHFGVHRSYATNGLNQYTGTASEHGGTGYGYDANGNLISDGTRTFTYDIENRLVGATGSGATVTLAYDPLGRLATSTPGAQFTRFLYDGDALVAEYDSNGAVAQRYVHGSGVDEPLFHYQGGAVSWQNRRQLFPDTQGSIVAETDWLAANPVINSYDEYGIPGATNTGRFQYTGQIWLAELGIYHYKARLYSPTLGRFLQTDPVGYQGGINLYGYVGDDPNNLVDPTGNQPPEGGETERARMQGLMEIGRDIYRSETKADDAALFGAVGLMAAGPVGMSAGPQVATVVLVRALPLTEGAATAAEVIAPGAGGAAAFRGLRPHESGPANSLQARSQVGDGLDVHHAPQSHVAAQVSPTYNSRTGPAIALPEVEHQAIPRLRGQVNITPRQMLARETRNLRSFTTATTAQIREWLSFAKQYFGVD
jgi:RHS repeat-associated protein